MIKSFKYAFFGVKNLFFFENNAKFHLLAAILVLIAGLFLHISSTEWIFLIFAIGLVFGAEAFNTSIEKLCDKVSSGQDPLIKQAKDLAAAAVLFFAISAALIGLIIFIPKILVLL
jgi:diacylglycerol kinase (ATP)